MPIRLLVLSPTKKYWKGVLFVVHWNSKGVLHVASWRWHQQSNQKNNKCNNGIKGNMVIVEGHSCNNESTMAPVHIVATMYSNTDLSSLLQQCDPTTASVCIVATGCFNNGLSLHCCNRVLQQWPWVMGVA
jgi:hypothetical protein